MAPRADRPERRGPAVGEQAPFDTVRTPVFALFFLSGACALVYQTTWMRLFRLVMGNTVFTSAMVLTVFMAGLAGGSYLAGRIADRCRRPLRLYGLLEGAIAGAALLVLALFTVVEPVYGVVNAALVDSPILLSISRFALSSALLIVPTTLIGATLPLLSRYVVTAQQELGRQVGRLYAVNTLGAAAGAAASGFVFLPRLGVAASLLLAVAGNVLIGAVAWQLSRRHEAPSPAGAQRAAARPAVTQERGATLLTAIAMVGFASMIYEVAWTRVLSMLVGSSVYAFSLMLVAFISGLGLGGVAISQRLDHVKRPVLLLVALQAVVGLSALVVVPLLGRLPLWVVDLVAGHAGSFHGLLAVEFGVIFLLMLVPTFAMGGVFPTVARIYATDVASVGRSVGEIYAANTLGAVAGSFAAGFLLVPSIGVRGAILVGVTVNLAIAAWFLATARWPGRGLVLTAGVATAAAAVVLMPRWDPMLMNSAPYLYAQRYRTREDDGADLAEVMRRSRRLLYAEEGLTASVTVVESGGELFLKVNGKTDASSRGDLRSQSLLTHLPLLLHPDPGRVLLIGLGSGISLGAAEIHALDTVECVEISAEVVAGARLFAGVNHDALADRRLDLHIGDGRNHLAFSRHRYDAVISQPSNLWIAGMADLFSREFFVAARERLAPGGLVCTWIQAYAVLERDFQVILKTFRQQFRHVTVWESVPGGDYFVVGSLEPVELDAAALRYRAEKRGLGADLARIGVGDVDNLLCSYVMDETGIDRYTVGSPVNTDDNTLLEFSAPRGLFQAMLGASDEVFDVGDLAGYRAATPPFAMDGELRERWRIRRQVLAAADLVRVGNPNEALEALGALPEAASQDMEFRRLLSSLALDQGEAREEQGDAEGALRLYRGTLGRLGEDSQLWFRVGRAAEGLAREQEALEAFDQARRLDPDLVAPHLHAAELRLRADDREGAEAALEAGLRADPGNGRALADMGRLRMEQHRWDEAHDFFQRAAERSPRDAQLHNNAGVARFQQGRYAEALDWFRKATRLNPGYVRAHNNTAEALMALGYTDKARQALDEALRHEPSNPRSAVLQQRLERAASAP